MSVNDQQPGEMTEWFKVLVLKTSVGQLTVGSNPTLSARKKRSPTLLVDERFLFARKEVFEPGFDTCQIAKFDRW